MKKIARNLALISLFAIALISCNSEINKKDAIINSTKIIIVQPKKNVNPDLENKSSSIENIYEAKTEEQLKLFRNVFKNAQLTDYCCCPDENYFISFYHSKKVIGSYWIDTLEFKDKIRIYDPGYQYSFIIDKIMWEAFFQKTNSIK